MKPQVMYVNFLYRRTHCLVQDVLKILHVAMDDVAEYTATDVVKKYQAVVEAALVDAEVVLEQKLPGKTVAQQISAFVSASNAHYLAMGIDGMARFMAKVFISTYLSIMLFTRHH
jgi:hypothetical protein